MPAQPALDRPTFHLATPCRRREQGFAPDASSARWWLTPAFRRTIWSAMPERDDDLGCAGGAGAPERPGRDPSSSATVPANRRGGVVARHMANPATRSGYALVASSAITSIVGVVFWWVGARWWTADELGRGWALVAAMALVAAVATLGMSGGLMRALADVRVGRKVR